MLNYKDIKSKLALLNPSTVVLVAGHKNADYDSIASCIAMAKLLKKLGIEAYALIENKDMDKLYWLYDEVVINEFFEIKLYNFILVDANKKERLGAFEHLFDNALLTINIDHHEDGLNESDYCYIDSDISSTCEMIANLCLEYDNILDKDIATLLYAGIVADTNSFFYRTTANTMKIASILLSYNVDNHFVVKHTTKNMTLNEAVILSDMLSEIAYDSFHYIVLTRKYPLYTTLPYSLIFKDCASHIYTLSDINVFGLFLIELDGSVSGLLRSNCDIDVNTLAEEFGGGGHKKAAGFETTMNVYDIIDRIKEYIEKGK